MIRQSTWAVRQRAKRAPTSNRPIVRPCTAIVASPQCTYPIPSPLAGEVGNAMALPGGGYAAARAASPFRSDPSQLRREVRHYSLALGAAPHPTLPLKGGGAKKDVCAPLARAVEA